MLLLLFISADFTIPVAAFYVAFVCVFPVAAFSVVIVVAAATLLRAATAVGVDVVSEVARPAVGERVSLLVSVPFSPPSRHL